MLPLFLPSVHFWCCIRSFVLSIKCAPLKQYTRRLHSFELGVKLLEMMSSPVCVAWHRVFWPIIRLSSCHPFDLGHHYFLQILDVVHRFESEVMSEDKLRHNVTVTSDHPKHHNMEWVFGFHQNWYILWGQSNQTVLWILADFFLIREKNKYNRLEGCLSLFKDFTAWSFPLPFIGKFFSDQSKNSELLLLPNPHWSHPTLFEPYPLHYSQTNTETQGNIGIGASSDNAKMYRLPFQISEWVNLVMLMLSLKDSAQTDTSLLQGKKIETIKELVRSY